MHVFMPPSISLLYEHTLMNYSGVNFIIKGVYEHEESE